MIRQACRAAALSFILIGCSAEESGCKSDNDCKGDRICKAGSCADPNGSGTGGTASGGNGSGGIGTGGFGTGGTTATGGGAGCPKECQTSAGTCCQGKSVCDITPPCSGNPCCS